MVLLPRRVRRWEILGNVRREWSVRGRWQLFGRLTMEAEVRGQKLLVYFWEEEKDRVEERPAG